MSVREANRPAYQGLHTTTSYYVPLIATSDCFRQKIDVIAICTEVFPVSYQTRADNFILRFSITDESLLGSREVKVLIAQSEESALPACRRGDVILLRDFVVLPDKKQDQQSRSQGLKYECLRSINLSAWMVITAENYMNGGRTCTRQRIETSDRPVEYTDEELEYATYVRTWWEKSQTASVFGEISETAQ
jgi:hypothetical protein